VFIELTNEAGHKVITPLWQLPGMVAKEVEKKRGHIAAIKAEQEAAALAEKAAEEAKHQEAIAFAGALSAPFDLSSDPGV
jgi:hypothetical protein